MRFSGREVDTVKTSRPTWFKFWVHHKELVDAIPDENLGKGIKAALHYFSTAAAPELDPLSNIAFSIFKPAIDASFADFEATSARNRKNIEKRWRESDTTRIRSYQVEASGNNSLPTDTEDRSQKSEVRSQKIEDRSKKSETDIIKAVKPPNKKFVPPSLDDVKAYAKERDSVVDAEYFIDFYASKGWKVGRETMKDWKAAFRRAEKWDCWGKISKTDIKDAESYKTDESEGFYFDC